MFVCVSSTYASIALARTHSHTFLEDQEELTVFAALVEACPRPTLIGWEAESESGGPASYFTLPPYWLSGEDGPFCGWTRFIHMNQIPYISHFTAGVMVK